MIDINCPNNAWHGIPETSRMQVQQSFKLLDKLTVHDRIHPHNSA